MAQDGIGNILVLGVAVGANPVASRVGLLCSCLGKTIQCGARNVIYECRTAQ